MTPLLLSTAGVQLTLKLLENSLLDFNSLLMTSDSMQHHINHCKKLMEAEQHINCEEINETCNDINLVHQYRYKLKNCIWLTSFGHNDIIWSEYTLYALTLHYYNIFDDYHIRDDYDLYGTGITSNTQQQQPSDVTISDTSPIADVGTENKFPTQSQSTQKTVDNINYRMHCNDIWYHGQLPWKYSKSISITTNLHTTSTTPPSSTTASTSDIINHQQQEHEHEDFNHHYEPVIIEEIQAHSQIQLQMHTIDVTYECLFSVIQSTTGASPSTIFRELNQHISSH